jgi:hypothetical protein
MAMKKFVAVLSSSLVVGLFLAAILVGCKSTGSGSGESRSGDVKVNFTWQQSEAVSGTLAATVTDPSGRQETYQGKFYQITQNSHIETIGGLWDPWYPRWGGWAYWGPEPEDSFIEHYTGHVVANLSGPDGKRMRCQFQLLRADEGMKGGGQGQCQLPSGKTIHAEFPPS